MNTPEQSNIFFSNPDMQSDFRSELGGLTQKLITLCNDHARNEFGETYLQNPSNIELTPIVGISDDPMDMQMVVRAWHETNTLGKSGVLQRHDTMAGLSMRGEDAYLEDTDTQTAYPITARETRLIDSIASAALVKLIFLQNRDK